MLSELYIKNLAIIEEASIPFSDNFNVFTGETGAGKSILINGINAVLGQRITKDIVRSGCGKAVITALFTGLSERVCERLDELGVSHEDGQLTLTREVSSDGGSIARVNSRASSVSVLREIGECLVNIHGQHDNQILMDPEKHLAILDSYGGLEEDVKDYRESFRQLQDISRRLKKMTLERKERLVREKELRECAREIGELEISENEDEEIESEYKRARSSEDICRSLSEAYGLLDGVEDSDVPGAAELIANACDSISAFSEMAPGLRTLSDRLENIRVELEDIVSEIARERDSVDIDGERYGYLTERLNELNGIKKKYGPELTDVFKRYDETLKELELIDANFDETEQTAKERERLLAEVSEKAKNLSRRRAEAAERFSAQVEEELRFLDMAGVRICAAMEKGKLTANGMDCVEFMISTNEGEGMKQMSKIASGGELSRIMLALKNVVAEKDDIHTLIFDEIDTGVSGRAAQKIGIKLKSVSGTHQVLCVTHLSQMAVMADNHLLIEKKTKDGRTFTSVNKLSFDERKREIARIMVGENITDTALKNAEELLIDSSKIYTNS